MIVKCRKCRKSPRNCRCFEYRLVGAQLFADNVATEPVRGEEVGTWQTRRNSQIYLRPQFVDAYGPIAIIESEELLNEIKEAIANETFFLLDYEEREGIHIRDFDRFNRKRLPFLRRPRAKRGTTANTGGIVSCT